MAQFESKVPLQVSLYDLNVDERSSPDMARFGQLIEVSGGGIPLTVWLDSKGKPLNSKVGVLTAAELTRLTQQALAARS